MKSLSDISLILLIFGIGLLSAQTASPAASTGAFVEVDGSRLYYEECGTGPKAMVLLHDGVVNSAVWDDVWPTFCKQFPAIRYDRRGYGRSPATKKPYYEVDDVASLLLDRKVSQAALVASSHGGNVALSFALRYPAQVSGLVLIGPEAEGFPYSEHFAMSQTAFQNARDPTEIRVQNTYFIVPGHDAAREHLRKLPNCSTPLRKTISTRICRCRRSQSSHMYEIWQAAEKGYFVGRKNQNPTLAQPGINSLRTLVSDIVGGAETFSAAC